MHYYHSVVDYWDVEAVRTKMSPGQDAVCYLALAESQVIGFSIGYMTWPQDLEKILKLEGLKQKIIKTLGQDVQVAYQTDIGVLEGWRRLGIAKQLFVLRHNAFRKASMKLAIVRTKPGTVTYDWYNKYGYQILASYPDSDPRVILAKKI